MKRIYLDNAATTKLDNQVKNKMIEAMDFFANPSSMYQEAFFSKKILNDSRKKIAEILNVEKEEIIFTGSGTESDNLAIFGVARANKEKGRHIITTKIEHPAVLCSMEQLEKEDFDITYLNVKKNGIIDIDEFKKSLCKDTILVSIMYVNNEIGTIQPIKKISETLRNYTKTSNFKKIIFHTDACQAINYLNIDIKKIGVDLMTFSGSKIYGPKGIGVLYKNEDIRLEPIIYGGGQEINLRSGTENIFLIAGLAEALKITQEKKDYEVERLNKLKNYFIEKLKKEIPKILINGSLKYHIPNNINVSIFGVEGEALLLMLDNVGINAATGSACSSKNLQTSHVLEAISIPEEYIHGSLRFSFGRETTKDDLDYMIKELRKIVERLRSFSVVS